MKIEKVYARDIIALLTLIACFILLCLKINSFVMWILTVVIMFYFARRFDGEGMPSKDINKRVEKIEEKVTEIPKTSQVPTKKQKNLSKVRGVIVKPPI